MSCERFSVAITDHACGAPIGAEAAAHLSGCAACRRALEMRRRLLGDAEALLGRELSLSASPDFVARVAARIHGAAPRREFRKMAAASWLALAAAALLAIAVFLRQPDGPRQETAQAVSAPAAVAPAITPTPGMAPPSRADTRASGAPAAAGTAPASARRPLRPRGVEPPVIVEPDRAAALARLRELLANGALTGTMLPPARSGDDAFEELTIAPMVIPDIVVPDVDNSGRGNTAPERQEKES